jgi:hypothetical protein
MNNFLDRAIMDPIPEQEIQTNSSRGVLAASVIVFIIVALFVAAYVYFRMYIPHQVTTAAVQPRSYDEVVGSLTSSNPSFVKATQALSARNNEDAVTYLNDALKTVDDPTEQILIQSNLGTANMRNGDYVSAAQNFLSIVKSATPNISRTQAYAVWMIGRIYYTKGTDPVVSQAIFGDPFFSGLLVQGDSLSTLINIFEYSAMHYPLAGSELEIADLYADKLIAMQNATSTQAISLVPTYKSKIQHSLDLAEKDIAYMRSEPRMLSQLQDALALKAITLGKLSEVGDADETVANAAFESSIQSYSSVGHGIDGNPRYYYAVELARLHGTSQAAKIHSLLAPIYTDSQYKKSPIEIALKKASFAGGTQNENILLLIKIDPQFKTYLQGLGWTSQEFDALSK